LKHVFARISGELARTRDQRIIGHLASEFNWPAGDENRLDASGINVFR
jgi:hypothetical protein